MKAPARADGLLTSVGAVRVKETYLYFLWRQLCQPQIWLLYLATFAIYLLYGWRSSLRQQIYFSIK